MKVALFDLGTNTFHLIIAELHGGGHYKILHKEKQPVKLLEGSNSSSEIRPIPFARAVEVLTRFVKKTKDLGVSRWIPLATSGIRSAANGLEFQKVVREKTGLEIKIISGEEEAELIYLGVKQSMNIGTENALILDIGGGSNEFILCNDKEVFWKQSFNLGAARMLSQFNPSDPITENEILDMHAYFKQELQPLFEACKKWPVHTLIGASGSFDTFAEMISFRYADSPFVKGQNEFEFNMTEYEHIHQMLMKSTTAERITFEGLVRMRVDMIVIATLFTKFIIIHCNTNRMRLSRGALKDGLLWKLANEF